MIVAAVGSTRLFTDQSGNQSIVLLAHYLLVAAVIAAMAAARTVPPIAAVRAAAGRICANWFDTHLRLAHGLFDHHGRAARGRVAIIVARRAVVVAAVIVAAMVVATAAMTRVAAAFGKRAGRDNKSQTENEQSGHSDLREAIHDKVLHTESFSVWPDTTSGRLQCSA
jgi:hypothetical protein